VSSRAVQIARVVVDGAPASTDVEDEAVLITTSMSALNFTGDSVIASAGLDGKVDVHISLPDIVDGGNF